MAEVPIDIEVYSNEDLVKDIALKLGDSSTAWNVSGATFKMNLETISGDVALALKSGTSGSNYIHATNLATGLISIRVKKSFLAENVGKTYRYDLVMTKSGVVKRLWGGSFKILAGVTE